MADSKPAASSTAAAQSNTSEDCNATPLDKLPPPPSPAKSPRPFERAASIGPFDHPDYVRPTVKTEPGAELSKDCNALLTNLPPHLNTGRIVPVPSDILASFPPILTETLGAWPCTQASKPPTPAAVQPENEPREPRVEDKLSHLLMRYKSSLLKAAKADDALMELMLEATCHMVSRFES